MVFIHHELEKDMLEGSRAQDKDIPDLAALTIEARNFF
jgi:hypothetical protein